MGTKLATHLDSFSFLKAFDRYPKTGQASLPMGNELRHLIEENVLAKVGRLKESRPRIWILRFWNNAECQSDRPAAHRRKIHSFSPPLPCVSRCTRFDILSLTRPMLLVLETPLVAETPKRTHEKNGDKELEWILLPSSTWSTACTFQPRLKCCRNRKGMKVVSDD